MKAFEYAAPRRESGVLELLASEPGQCEILAGGTDLIGLMKKMIVTPRRVVNIKEVRSLKGIQADSFGVSIGAVTTLDDVLEAPEMEAYPAVLDAIRGINSMQLQSQGTIGGELCQRTRCWYFRNGYGLLARNGRMVADGENRYHAIFGNAGPAKFVHASRLAPALLALGAKVRIVGPAKDEETILPLADFFQTPRDEQQRENVLAPNQLLTHVLLDAMPEVRSATYEVRHGVGPDYPLASAAAAFVLDRGIVREACIVMGHVAPIPWISGASAQSLLGQPVNAQTARAAGEAAVRSATPLSDNEYKVQLARVSVERAILQAAGLPTGGF